MNKFNPPTVLPLVLGAKIVPPTPVPVTTVELKPYLFLDKLTGRMSYAPPLPATPEKAEKPKLATPPTGEAVWHDEDPTEHGWYISTISHSRPTDRVRYWNGAWSCNRFLDSLLSDPRSRHRIPEKSHRSDDVMWLCKVEFPA